jgi:hypothetical protein
LLRLGTANGLGDGKDVVKADVGSKLGDLDGASVGDLDGARVGDRLG